MALILNEEQGMLRESARDFLKNESPVAQLRALRDSRDENGFSPALWGRFAQMGFTGVLIPESHGGLGLGHVEAGIIMEQIGHHLTASPFLASSIAAASAVLQAGTAQQKTHFLPKLASGELIATLAIDEAAKHAPEKISGTARKTSTGWILDGSKAMVLDGHVAQLLIVSARIDNGDCALFLVVSQHKGVSVERTQMLDAHNAARVTFQQVQLEPSALLGEPAEASKALRAALDAGRLAASAELLGLADEAFARTVSYLKERKQFDKLIGEFQALQHRAALVHTELELTRAALIKAQQAMDSEPTAAPMLVAVAKARAGIAATLAVQEAVQMHGGMGMTDAFEIGFFMKRARVLQELWGDSNFHLNAFAVGRGY